MALLLLSCPSATGPLVMQRELPKARVTTKPELVLRCVPVDAEVVLDGVPQGTCADFDGAPRGLFLGLARRRVEVRKQGFYAWESIIESDGTRVSMNVSLVAKGQGR